MRIYSVINIVYMYLSWYFMMLICFHDVWQSGKLQVFDVGSKTMTACIDAHNDTIWSLTIAPKDKVSWSLQVGGQVKPSSPDHQGHSCHCYLFMIMKNFNRHNFHGHHGSKLSELVQHTLTWIARIHSHTLHQHSYNHVVRSASSAIIFQCMLGLFMFP